MSSTNKYSLLASIYHFDLPKPCPDNSPSNPPKTQMDDDREALSAAVEHLADRVTRLTIAVDRLTNQLVPHLEVGPPPPYPPSQANVNDVPTGVSGQLQQEQPHMEYWDLPQQLNASSIGDDITESNSSDSDSSDDDDDDDGSSSTNTEGTTESTTTTQTEDTETAIHIRNEEEEVVEDPENPQTYREPVPSDMLSSRSPKDRSPPNSQKDWPTVSVPDQIGVAGKQQMGDAEPCSAFRTDQDVDDTKTARAVPSETNLATARQTTSRDKTCRNAMKSQTAGQAPRTCVSADTIASLPTASTRPNGVPCLCCHHACTCSRVDLQ